MTSCRSRAPQALASRQTPAGSTGGEEGEPEYVKAWTRSFALILLRAQLEIWCEKDLLWARYLHLTKQPAIVDVVLRHRGLIASEEELLLARCTL